jgi:RecA/RadA recombinase
MPLNNMEMKYLIAHLVRCDKVIQQAVALLLPTDFRDELEQSFALIWSISSDWYKKTSKPIPKDLMLSELDKSIQGAGPDWMSAVMEDETREMVEEIYSLTPEDFFPEHAINTWLQTLLNDKKVLPKLHNIDETDLPKAIKRLTDAYAATRVSAAVGCNVFDVDSADARVVSSRRSPTGCIVFDEILGGGIRERELIGILGPTSGGKTTLAVQIACSKAKIGDWVNFFSYEQPIVPEIRDRMWSCASGVSRKKIEEIPFDQMEKSVQNDIRLMQQMCKTMRAFDMQGKGIGFGGMDEVEAVVQQEIAADRHPKLIIIDWVSVVARRYMSANGIEESNIRGIILGMCNHAKSLAVKYETTVILMQQLNGEAGSRTNVRSKASHYDALDCKGFAFEMDACVVIGPKDPKNGNCVIKLTKARNVVNTERKAQLNGEFNRFDPLDGEFIADRDGEVSLIARADMEDVGDYDNGN